METQGLPLWAVRESTGQIYAVIEWREVEPFLVWRWAR